MRGIKFLLMLVVITATIKAVASTVSSTVIVGNQEMCSSPSFQLLTISPDLSSSGVTYSWFIDGRELQTGTTFHFEPAVAGNYIVEVKAVSSTEEKVVSKIISVLQTYEPEIINEKEMYCFGDQIEVGDKYNATDWMASWEFNSIVSTSKSIAVSESGNYKVRITSFDGCVSEDITTFVDLFNPDFDTSLTEIKIFRNSSDAILEMEIENVPSSVLTKWESSFGDVYYGNPVNINDPDEDATYKLSLSLEDSSCTTYSHSISLEVIEPLNISNAFSPNGDGLNDEWFVADFGEYKLGSIQIFNRWGRVVYEDYSGEFNSWDGTFEGWYLPIGTYYYIITSENSQVSNIHGAITITK